MPDIALIVAVGVGLLAIAIAVLGLFRARASGSSLALTREQAAELFRGESLPAAPARWD